MDRAAHAVEQWRRERPDPRFFRPMIVPRAVGRRRRLVIARRQGSTPLFSHATAWQPEFDVLATLRRSGAPYALTPTALYDAAMISSGSMTNRIDRLEKAGWVERRPNPADGRGTLVALTPAGLALIDDAVVAHVGNQQRALSALSDAEQRQLAKLLGKLLQGQADER
ncbi:MarR family transcriptional regulator [Burkholderia pseudomallei]|nr:MarR family transcriptional regulator [Burkholderia pseudomallei]